MNTTTNAALGVLFLALGLAATGLMYDVWGGAFDMLYSGLEAEAADLAILERYLTRTFVEAGAP